MGQSEFLAQAAPTAGPASSVTVTEVLVDVGEVLPVGGTPDEGPLDEEHPTPMTPPPMATAERIATPTTVRTFIDAAWP